jgi:hypothetical protein
MCKRLSCLSLCGILLAIASIASAEKKAVTYERNGRRLTIQGEVTRTQTGYDVKTDLGTISISNRELVEITEIVDPATEYARRRAEIQDNQTDKLLELADWAVKRGLLQQARKDLQLVLKQQPDNIRADIMLRRVNAMLAGDDDDDDDANDNQRQDNKDLLSMEDIYAVRREELDSGDKSVAIELRNNLPRRFARSMQGQGDFRDADFERTFLSWKPIRQARYIMRHTQPGSALREDIIIKSDPGFMVDFTREVWPIVQRNCARTKCHGGDRARGGLKLFLSKSPRARYTNFVILTGVRNDKSLPIINRITPERSLLVEYLLPRKVARFPHPTKIPPLFERGDRKYRRLVKWAGSLDHFPRVPDYRLQYKPPYGMKLIFRDKSGVSDLLPDKDDKPDKDD